MKLFNLFWGIMVAASLLSGCKEDSVVTGLSSGMMEARINGTPFVATGILAIRNPAGTGFDAGFTVSGNANLGYPQIILTLYSGDPGKYQLGVSGSGTTNAVFATSGSAPEVSISGIIDISGIDYSEGGTVKGTFEFDTNSHTITGGVFEVRFSN